VHETERDAVVPHERLVAIARDQEIALGVAVAIGGPRDDLVPVPVTR
jgi:hypothetical protein